MISITPRLLSAVFIIFFTFIMSDTGYSSVLTVGCDILDENLNVIQARSLIQRRSCFIDKDYSFINYNPLDDELTRYSKTWKILWSKKIEIKKMFGKTEKGTLFYKTQEFYNERYCPVLYDKIVGVDQASGKVVIVKSLKKAAVKIINDFKIPAFFKEKVGNKNQCQFTFNANSLSEMPGWKTARQELNKKGNLLFTPTGHAGVAIFTNDLSQIIEYIDLSHLFRGGFEKAIALDNGKIIFIKHKQLYVHNYFTKTTKRIYPRVAQNQFVEFSIFGQKIKISPAIDEQKAFEKKNMIVELTADHNQMVVSMIVDSQNLVHFRIDDEGNLIKASPEIFKIKKELQNPFEFYRGDKLASFWSKWVFN